MQHLSLFHHYFAFWYGRFENASWDLIWPYNDTCNVDSGTVAPCHIHLSDGCLEILSSCSSAHTEGKGMVLLEHADLFYLCWLCWQYLHLRTNSFLHNCPYPNTLQQSVTWTFVKMTHLIDKRITAGRQQFFNTSRTAVIPANFQYLFLKREHCL